MSATESGKQVSKETSHDESTASDSKANKATDKIPDIEKQIYIETMKQTVELLNRLEEQEKDPYHILQTNVEEKKRKKEAEKELKENRIKKKIAKNFKKNVRREIKEVNKWKEINKQQIRDRNDSVQNLDGLMEKGFNASEYYKESSKRERSKQFNEPRSFNRNNKGTKKVQRVREEELVCKHCGSMMWCLNPNQYHENKKSDKNQTMAKRKSSRLKLRDPYPSNQRLATRFDCPICHSSDVVKCTINSRGTEGSAFCMICRNNFSCKANRLTKPVDVYAEWIDDISKN